MTSIPRLWQNWWLLLTLLVLLSSCSQPGLPVSEQISAPPTSVPTTTLQLAFAHRTARAWIVADHTALLASLPPPADLPSIPPAPTADLQAVWEQPVVAWMNVELEAIKREQTSPPRAARALALLAGGLNDSLLTATTARATGMTISNAALLSSTALRILRYNHPLLSSSFEAQAGTAAFGDAWKEHATPAAIERGLRLGHAVGEAVVAVAKQDGADIAVPPMLPHAALGVWQPTPPMFALPLEPGWGQVKPVVIASGSSVAAPPPPAWESPAFQQDRAAFAEIQRGLTASDRALAQLWAGEGGSVTPPGLWVELTRNLVARNALSLDDSAQVFAAVTIAMHDAFIACWASKFQYLVARPVTWMRETEPTWKPLLKTPPFPSYPSGHATISAAAATVLAVYFPASASTLAQDAEDAARSRIIGGIHWPLDGAGGLEQGRRVGRIIVEQLLMSSEP